MAAPKEIVDLVEKFENNLESYKRNYNETQTRVEFVNPFFKALGWDIDNEQGFAEAYKDVIHEDAIKVGGTTRAPDYSFRIGGQRKFFLETKQPAVNIKDDIDPAFQLRRYAWTAKLPLSILTDFEQFSVYELTEKPDKTDKAAKGRIIYLTYNDYLAKWDEIASIFSKNAVLKGSFDKYAQDKKRKRGTDEVDAAFLEEIASWREILAKNIALRNPDLSTKDLNYAVQVIVNRIVFLRICEDRGIERLMKLQDLLNGERVYPRLCEIFRRADERYNSGIFHFEKEPGRASPDTLTLNLNIDDKPLRDIIKRLYYPDSPYEFSVLPAEILGQVYEQFLGKVIRLTEGHRAVVEDKPEVKKAGGVKYTPVYIVVDIVGNTLGKILNGKTPHAVVLISVLDPACGSGSFLIVAYQYLLDWHREWYVQNMVPLLQSGLKPSSPEIQQMIPRAQNDTNKRGRKKEIDLPIYQGKGGEWRLTTAERKRILLNNIYGVDIDRQAVEVTKLSLLLKVLEGENDETISKQLTLFQERALPDLGNNIKCGNSLIGWDILKDNPGLTQEEIERINPFDWEKEFPEIFKRGGFSVVIGNPPYLGGREWKEEYGRQYEYFMRKFAVAEYQFDIYSLFWEQGIRLLKHEGLIGFITPNTWLNNKSNTKLRKFILRETAIESITDYSHINVFSHTVVLPIVTIASRRADHANQVRIFSVKEDLLPTFSHSFPQNLWQDDALSIFNIAISVNDIAIREKIESAAIFLEELSSVKFGIKLYETGKGKPPQKAEDAVNRVFEANYQVNPNYRPYLEGKDVNQYEINWQERWLLYGPNLAAPRDPTLFSGARLLFRRIVGNRLIGTYTDEDYVTSQLLQIVKPGDSNTAKYLLGVLNSSLIAYYFRKKYNRQDKTFPEIRIYELASMPIRVIDVSKPKDAENRDRIVSLVDRMLSLHEQLHEARTPHEQKALQRQIEATDGQIDALVYELYGLTEEEIKIVEGAG